MTSYAARDAGFRRWCERLRTDPELRAAFSRKQAELSRRWHEHRRATDPDGYAQHRQRVREGVVRSNEQRAQALRRWHAEQRQHDPAAYAEYQRRVRSGIRRYHQLRKTAAAPGVTATPSTA